MLNNITTSEKYLKVLINALKKIIVTKKIIYTINFLCKIKILFLNM